MVKSTIPANRAAPARRSLEVIARKKRRPFADANENPYFAGGTAEEEGAGARGNRFPATASRAFTAVHHVEVCCPDLRYRNLGSSISFVGRVDWLSNEECLQSLTIFIRKILYPF